MRQPTSKPLATVIAIADSGEYPLINEFLSTDAPGGIDRVAQLIFSEGRCERGLARLLGGMEAAMARK